MRVPVGEKSLQTSYLYALKRPGAVRLVKGTTWPAVACDERASERSVEQRFDLASVFSQSCVLRQKRLK